MRELKIKNTLHKDAAIQYDCWFRKWKELSSIRAQAKGSKRHQTGFAIYNDCNDSGNDNDNDGDVLNNNYNKNNNKNKGDNEEDDETIDTNDERSDVSPSSPPPATTEKSKQKPPPLKKLIGNEMRDLLFELYVDVDSLKLLTFINKEKYFQTKRQYIVIGD